MLAIAARTGYNIYTKIKKGKLKFMPKTAKPVTYNDNDRAIVNALKGTEGLTLTEINEATGLSLVSGNIVSAMKKCLIAASVEKEVERPVIRPVSTYAYVTS